jgi:hypothetical protein
MNAILKMLTAISFILGAVLQVDAQGFMNLNFENASVVLAYPPSTGYIISSSALPGWTVYSGPPNNPTYGNLPIIGYNTLALDGGGAFLEDTNAPSSITPIGIGILPIQGTYSVLLQGSTLAAQATFSVGQTGTIPVAAQSLRFFASLGGTVLVSFNGYNLPFSTIGTGPNYTILGADISAYAGETGQLLFTAPVQNAALLDNIQFSSSPIPEPSTFGLFAMGVLFFGLRRWR